jgi:hypothetical protein
MKRRGESPIQDESKRFRYCPTLPTFDIEYSPCHFEEKSILPTPHVSAKQLLFTDSAEESIHASKVGDITLDQIIDEILMSAKKPLKKAKYTSSPSYQRCYDPASDLIFMNGELIL